MGSDRTLLALLAAAAAGACATTPKPPAPWAEPVLEAEWAPVESSRYGLFERVDALRALGEVGPAVPSAPLDAASLDALLPPEGLAEGATWRPDHRPLFALLERFHPGATPHLHHGSGAVGARAVLLERSSRRTDVLVRVHADFVIGEQVWYTPAQFEGRAVWEGGQLVWFELGLPPRDTNVDANAYDEGFGAVLADIGYCPRMRLAPRAAAGLAGPPSRDEEELAAARLALARAFYRFAAIDWLPLDRAVELARDTGRPLHAVLLFGTLDDESC